MFFALFRRILERRGFGVVSWFIPLGSTLASWVGGETWMSGWMLGFCFSIFACAGACTEEKVVMLADTSSVHELESESRCLEDKGGGKRSANCVSAQTYTAL